MIDNSLFNIHGKLTRINYPAVMGIVNLSQNSFYSKSVVKNMDTLTLQVNQYLEEGVDIIDLGAGSTRPGSKLVDPTIELKQLEEAYQIVRALSGNTLISIDTMNAHTARCLLQLGADMINDVSASEYDKGMLEVIAEYNVPYIAMHMRGIPETMQSSENLNYDDLVSDIIQYFSLKKFEFLKKGIHQVIFDPGFGFSKSLTQNYELLRKLNLFQILQCPILIGISRKSMIAKVLNTDAEHSLEGSLVAETLALLNGAQILRVHDVKETVDLIRIYQAYNGIQANV